MKRQGRVKQRTSYFTSNYIDWSNFPSFHHRHGVNNIQHQKIELSGLHSSKKKRFCCSSPTPRVVLVPWTSSKGTYSSSEARHEQKRKCSLISGLFRRSSRLIVRSIPWRSYQKGEIDSLARRGTTLIWWIFNQMLRTCLGRDCRSDNKFQNIF
jgi:hypothetical protein